MIAGRPIDIEAARGADDGYRRTIAVEVSRLEPHFVTGERYPERRKIFTAATKTKSDRLEKATIVQKLVPTRAETFLTFSPALVEEMLRGAPRQFNPRLDAAAVRASRAPNRLDSSWRVRHGDGISGRRGRAGRLTLAFVRQSASRATSRDAVRFTGMPQAAQKVVRVWRWLASCLLVVGSRTSNSRSSQPDRMPETHAERWIAPPELPAVAQRRGEPSNSTGRSPISSCRRVDRPEVRPR